MILFQRRFFWYYFFGRVLFALTFMVFLLLGGDDKSGVMSGGVTYELAFYVLVIGTFTIV
jgi:hypothetical protein